MLDLKEDINLWISFNLADADEPNIKCDWLWDDPNPCACQALFKVYFEAPCSHCASGVPSCLEHRDMALEDPSEEWECDVCEADLGLILKVERL